MLKALIIVGLKKPKAIFTGTEVGDDEQLKFKLSIVVDQNLMINTQVVPKNLLFSSCCYDSIHDATALIIQAKENLSKKGIIYTITDVLNGYYISQSSSALTPAYEEVSEDILSEVRRVFNSQKKLAAPAVLSAN